MATKTHKTYRVNADRTDVLVDLLVGTPEEFNSDRDKLHGRAETSTTRMGSGRLNGADYDTFMSNRVQGRITYVIYSYSTPIAWRIWDRGLFGGKPGPNWQQYWVLATGTGGTNTTAKHMAKVRAAISRIDAWHLAATSPPNV